MTSRLGSAKLVVGRICRADKRNRTSRFVAFALADKLPGRGQKIMGATVKADPGLSREKIMFFGGGIRPLFDLLRGRLHKTL